MEKSINKNSKKPISYVTKEIIVYVLLFIWAIIVLLPFYWMILTSFKTNASYNAEIVPQFIARSPTLENYAIAWTKVPLARYMLNTVVFSITTTLLMIVVSIMAAFAFARLEFKGKNLVFTIFLSMMMIPNELIILTNYVTITNAGLRDTFTGLILPSVLSIFYIYLLRQNFMQVPDALYYAAKVDGLKDHEYLLKVLIPLSKPTIISIIILKLIECWNSYVWPKLITRTDSKSIVSLGIETIRSTLGGGQPNYPAMMAAVVCVSLPLLIIFLIFRKQIMSGVLRTGTKG